MTPIISKNEFVNVMRERFPELKIHAYKLRDYYSGKSKLFFDCEGDLDKFVKKTLEYAFHQRYVTYIVIKKADRFEFQSISYRNPAVESLEHFIGRYESTIKPSLAMTLVGSDKEFVELLGFSYE